MKSIHNKYANIFATIIVVLMCKKNVFKWVLLHKIYETHHMCLRTKIVLELIYVRWFDVIIDCRLHIVKQCAKL